MSLACYVYEGCRDGSGVAFVHRDGDLYEVGPSLKVENHSPTGFEWAYGGSGPAQLALAILLDHLDPVHAVELHQKFKWQIVAKLPKCGWKLSTFEVMAWVAEAFDAQAAAVLEARG